ncbi:MAG: hypothetical protein RB191_16060 [Terriglobia bacterium]|nr:hypothetical protein [Terriglobia bacterium]
MPSTLKKALMCKVESDGYGVRGKSKWIREAFLAMIDRDPGLQYVGQGDRIEPQDEQELITLPKDLSLLLSDKVLQLRLAAPTLEGPRSLLLRSAIRYRLANPGSFLAKPLQRARRSG